MRQHCPHPDPLQVDPFEAIIDAGRAGAGRHSVYLRDSRMKAALKNAMNYSVGFRAPNSREASGFADTSCNGVGQYILPATSGICRPAYPADNLPQEMDKLRTAMLDGSIAAHFQMRLGEFRHAATNWILRRRSRRISLMRRALRCLKARRGISMRLGAFAYCVSAMRFMRMAKNRLSASPRSGGVVSHIALTAEKLRRCAGRTRPFLAMLAALVNKGGYWFFEGEHRNARRPADAIHPQRSPPFGEIVILRIAR